MASRKSESSVGEVLTAVAQLWPYSGAEEWDTPGLQVGSTVTTVTSGLVAVDVTPEVIEEALMLKCDLIISHHPLLLRSVSAIDAGTDRGSLVIELVRNSLTHIAAHTNADVVTNGVSDLIAQALQLTNVVPLVEGSDPSSGLGRVGNLPQPQTLRALAETLSRILPQTAGGVNVGGDPETLVTRVSLCGGAGDSLLTNEKVMKSDVFITSDLRHHPALDARIRAQMGVGPWLINTSHWASESLWTEQASSDLSRLLPAVTWHVSRVNTDPWSFSVV